MVFQLEVLPAMEGDCLLLHYGDDGDPRLMLIDGGPGGVYGAHLKPRLEELHAAHADPLAPKPLKIDVLMVSHVDDDHIGGILNMTRDLKATGAPRRYKVLSLWHNALETLLAGDPGELSSTVALVKGAAAFDDDGLEALMPEEPEEMILASYKQGLDLRSDADLLGWDINAEFGGAFIEAKAGDDPVDMGGGLTLRLVGPLQPEVAKLREEYEKFLKEKASAVKPASLLAAFEDESVTNLSSIVALATLDGRSLLLTGDARGDKVLKGLEEMGLMPAAGPLPVDVLKVPHHGSCRNLAPVFFERIHADHYVFSGNGKHGNPDRETIEMLLDARPGGAFTLHFTYPIAEIDQTREAEWAKDRAKELKRAAAWDKLQPEQRRGKRKDRPLVREPWDHGLHSLAACLSQRNLPNARQVINEIPDGGRHTIDLLAPRAG